MSVPYRCINRCSKSSMVPLNLLLLLFLVDILDDNGIMVAVGRFHMRSRSMRVLGVVVVDRVVGRGGGDDDEDDDEMRFTAVVVEAGVDAMDDTGGGIRFGSFFF